MALSRGPNHNEFEFTLLGPGYGECVVLHVGNGNWVVVDSYADSNGIPIAIKYLEGMGFDPAQSVILIVATHWHDDHIRGIANLVEICPNAKFCCATVLCDKEFLAVADALEKRPIAVAGSGVREIYRIFSRFINLGLQPVYALADRCVFAHDMGKIWSLSPSDAKFQDFLRSVSRMLPSSGHPKKRIPSLSPNKTAIALWLEFGKIVVLLGADLDKRGWMDILESTGRPEGRASAFKVPHHGAKSGHEPAVWERMLEPDPLALLAPWCRGGRVLPNQRDVERLVMLTSNGWSSSEISRSNNRPKRRKRMVERTIRESEIQLRPIDRSLSAIRLRRQIKMEEPWKVEKFGTACRL